MIADGHVVGNGDLQADGSEKTAPEFLRELAENMKWPRWFDSADGQAFASYCRPRLLDIAMEIEVALRDLQLMRAKGLAKVIGEAP